MTQREVSLGLLGCGTVGSGLVELLERSRDVVLERSGLKPRITRVAVRDLSKPRPIERSRLTQDAQEVLCDPSVEVVVELMGGVEPARSFILKAIEAGKHVVTANKAVLAAHGEEILAAARKRRVRVGFEASVCAGIPVLRALAQGLVGNNVESISGIVNGTCNFILTRMTEDRASPEAALAEAQQRGFAESDPSLDLDGVDAAQKLLILARLAFGSGFRQEDIRVEGIRAIGTEDIEAAREFGRVLKHIVEAWREPDGLHLRVGPVLLRSTHPLALVRDEFNSVALRADAVGEMVFSGRGAGALPTASAVLADIVDVSSGVLPPLGANDGNGHVPKVLPLAPDTKSEFYLRFPIRDVPGVIGLLATGLGNHGLSISAASAVLSPGVSGKGHVRFLLHEGRESVVRRAVQELSRLPVMAGSPVVIRVV